MTLCFLCGQLDLAFQLNYLIQQKRSEQAKETEVSNMSSAVGKTTDHRPGHSGQPKTKFEFNIADPIMVGHLRKQGEKGTKTFKRRFFALYRNYLVYYTDPVQWQSDKTYQSFRVSYNRFIFTVLTCFTL